MSYLKTIPYYVYKITLSHTGQYYYGSRYSHVHSNRLPHNDLWITYFTSSKVIKSLLKAYSKDNFQAEIIYSSFDHEETYWVEQDHIAANFKDSLCLNRTYIERTTGKQICNNIGRSAWVKDNQLTYSIESPGEGWIKQGRPRSETTKVKLKESATGRPRSIEHQNKLNQSRRSRPLGKKYNVVKRGCDHKNSSKHWWHNGQDYKYSSECPGEAWYKKGRPKSAEQISKERQDKIGRTYYHNGEEERMVHECPGPEWIKGRLYYKGKKIDSAVKKYEIFLSNQPES